MWPRHDVSAGEVVDISIILFINQQQFEDDQNTKIETTYNYCFDHRINQQH